ncbi:uncharacterized protein si:dkey-87o1.2 [Tachysurus fulvidraco]|uniref:uncharacterized protein si:dkey-87o1.2 n=1 Tax=Tachysurus fulvidraco TaxID=1234273 RepID=UPI001FED9721|nr:uncharacterized protein si:dkey-87o1.2 [Tachysurus fulvidraco]
MKSVWALVFLATCALVAVSFQAIQQEINIRKMRNIILSNIQEVKKKEDAILSSKTELQKLSVQLVPLDKEKIQLTKKLEDLVKEKEISEQNMNTCQTQKKEADQQRSQKTAETDAQKTNQNAEIQKVQEEVEHLKKQILDRDTKICVYVDKERVEGRALCVDKMPPS